MYTEYLFRNVEPVTKKFGHVLVSSVFWLTFENFDKF